MYSVATFADPTFLRTVHVEVMQVLVTISEPGRLAGSFKEKCVLIMAVEAERKILILIWDVEFSRVECLQKRFVI